MLDVVDRLDREGRLAAGRQPPSQPAVGQAETDAGQPVAALEDQNLPRLRSERDERRVLGVRGLADRRSGDQRRQPEKVAQDGHDGGESPGRGEAGRGV